MGKNTIITINIGFFLISVIKYRDRVCWLTKLQKQ